MNKFYIGWPTLASRSCLKNSIISFAENAVSFGHKPEFIISSDLENKEHINFALNISSEIEKKYKIKTNLIEKEKTSEFISKSLSGFDPEILSYALRNEVNHFGQNSNQLILATAGTDYIQSDDDVFCLPGILSNNLIKEFEYSNKYLPADLLLFNSREKLLNKINNIEVDYLSEHYNLLGKTINEDKIITITTSGAYGDCGMGNPRAILSAEGKSRLDKISSDEIYNKNKLAREIIRIPNQTIIGSGTHLMGMNIGINNSKLIPPFFPFGRNSDGFFSVMTRLIYQNSNTAFLGFGLYHDPMDKRDFSIEDLQKFKPNMVEIIMAIMLACNPSKDISSPSDRLIKIGEGLIEFSNYKKMEFEEIVHNVWSQGIQVYIQNLENLLVKYDRKPAAWANDVEILLDNIYELLREPTYLFSKKRCGYNSEDIQYHLNKYGNLLKIWPDVHAYSAKLNQEGCGLLNQKCE